MNWKRGIAQFSVEHARGVVVCATAAVLVCAGLGLMRGVRDEWRVVDTDPENMLSPAEPVRRFHDRVKDEFTLHDMVIVGVVNETHQDGIFNTGTLERIALLIDFIKGLDGVISGDLIAPTEVDVIEQASPGMIRFELLMDSAPETEREAARIKGNALTHPLLHGTLVSEDAQALCLYIPIEKKDLSHGISVRIRKKALELGMREMDSSLEIHGGEGEAPVEGDLFGITGLPVAEDTFGVEMFTQMAISAPMAMGIIFLLLLFFFRAVSFVISPMIVALFSVLSTMGLLIGAGFTVHIMSSMIPIFLMPIAVVDSVHILSEFFDRHRRNADIRLTVVGVMEELFTPMLYTSLTSAAGFASLALTPIPPVRVFGLFVALGILIAWFLTITVIPAYIALIPERYLDKVGAATGGGERKSNSKLGALLRAVMRGATVHSKAVLTCAGILIALAVYGITLIRVNDNPTRWFISSHRIRVADRILNSHFGGTYLAYLVLNPETGSSPEPEALIAAVRNALETSGGGEKGENNEAGSRILNETVNTIRSMAVGVESGKAHIDRVLEWAMEKSDAAPYSEYHLWEDVLNACSRQRARADIFKRPEVLEYMEGIQQVLSEGGEVGKTNSAVTLVKYVYRELMGGGEEHFRVPETARQVAECYIQAQNGHDPEDLWHFVTPDYGRANIWVQLKSGDNRIMDSVVKRVNRFIAENPPPVTLTPRWAGLTYVNLVWQDRMVSGMVRSLAGSFVIVLVMMIILFRSFLWGLFCMVPLSVTIALIYGVIGIAGKDYDMPVAVLSSLTLGLSVDFAIHYLQRLREIYAETGEWSGALKRMAGEPARAISRNAIVIAVGFLPLLAAPLVPYKTVGFFLAAIMAVSAAGTIILLPSLVTVARRRLFTRARNRSYTVTSPQNTEKIV